MFVDEGEKKRRRKVSDFLGKMNDIYIKGKIEKEKWFVKKICIFFLFSLLSNS